MSSDRPSESRSSGADLPATDPALADLVRRRGEPLLEALEAHLPGANEHAEATGSYAFATAVALGLGRAGAELCRETAKLHDIGMLYVTRTTAQAPFETLTEAQRAEFDAHYEAGARLALGAGIPDDVSGWLLQIRERYDGAGPDGIRGDAIPVAARIARAACACDTLLASPYGGETLDERRRDAIERLRAAAGRELDPGVAEALVEMLGRAQADDTSNPERASGS
jgi:HD-GYP domain-containing protein (c-di-GMP phosphodiesterase class II)